MASFPTLQQGGQMTYGSSKTLSYPAHVDRFLTGEEQRWVTQPPRATSISIVLQEISAYDLSVIRAFYVASNGPLNTTWSLTYDGTVYSNLAFEGDGFNPTLSGTPERWNLTLKVRQTA